MAALVDTNILVCRFDTRFPEKQRVATALLRQGIADASIRIAHQAIVEFVSAVTKHIRHQETGVLTPADARREAEELISQIPVLYPNEQVLRMALRGAAAYDLNWFDAHMWAYAEVYGLDRIYSEYFQADRVYGTVRVVNPFRQG